MRCSEIKPEDSMLLMIDMQEKLFNAMDEKIQTMLKKNSSILIETAKEFNIPIIITEQYRKGLGLTIPELLNLCNNDLNLEKTFFNCTKDEAIKNAITEKNKKNIIISGIESHICVLQTSLSLLDMGYNVIIASDAVASRRKSDWSAAMDILRGEKALVYPTESIAFMILEKAGTPQFKKISPLFK